MFCKNCGKEIDDKAAICTYCGVATKNETSSGTNTLAIVGFVLSLLVPVAGLVCSILARKKCRESGEGGEGLARAGIIISSVELGLEFVSVLVFGFAFVLMVVIAGSAAM